LRRFQEKQPKKSIDKADAVIHGATVRPFHNHAVTVPGPEPRANVGAQFPSPIAAELAIAEIARLHPVDSPVNCDLGRGVTELLTPLDEDVFLASRQVVTNPVRGKTAVYRRSRAKREFWGKTATSCPGGVSFLLRRPSSRTICWGYAAIFVHFASSKMGRKRKNVPLRVEMQRCSVVASNFCGYFFPDRKSGRNRRQNPDTRRAGD
jgi:hypothetical protein